MVFMIKSIEQNRPVYVHCLGVISPTGTVVGCYLARHGYVSDQRLIRHIQFLRKNAINHHLMSPETNQQIDLILSWGGSRVNRNKANAKRFQRDSITTC